MSKKSRRTSSKKTVSNERVRAASTINWRQLLLWMLLTAVPSYLCFAFDKFDHLSYRWIFSLFGFVCLVPTFVVIRSLNLKQTLMVGFVLGVTYYGSTITWISHLMGVYYGLSFVANLGVTVGLFIICGVVWPVALLIINFCYRRGNIPVWVMAPPAWTLMEYLHRYSNGGFPWANVGLSQVHNTLLIQTASLGGIYLSVWIVAWVNGVVAESWCSWRRTRKLPHRLIGATLLILFSAHLYGLVRIKSWSVGKDTPRLRAAYVQSNYDPRVEHDPVVKNDKKRNFAQRAFMAHYELTRWAKKKGVQLTVWPESSYPTYMPWKTKRIGESVIPRGTFSGKLLFGTALQKQTPEEPLYFNGALLLDSSGEIDTVYTKIHRVPFGEYAPLGMGAIGLRPVAGETVQVGNGETISSQFNVVDAKGQRALPRTVKLGILICYEALFPHLARSHAVNGAQVLVGITNDASLGYTNGSHQFVHHTRVRTIEAGLWMIRSARTGVSGFIDPLGTLHKRADIGLLNTEAKVVLEKDVNKPQSAWMDVPLLTSGTPYRAIGDLLVYLCLLFCLAAVARSYFKARQR